MFAPRLAVLEPVEHVGIAHLAVLLQLGSDPPDLIPWRVHHPRVEYSLQDPYLLRLRVPPWLWLRTPLLTPRRKRRGGIRRASTIRVDVMGVLLPLLVVARRLGLEEAWPVPV